MSVSGAQMVSPEKVEILESIEALVFDLDNVLFDKGDWVMHSLEYAAGAMGLDEQRAWELAVEFKNTHGVVNQDIYNYVLLGLGQSDSAKNIKAFCDLANQYRPMLGQVELYPGVEKSLKELRDHYKMGMVTDGPVLCQRAKVQALGLQDIFHEILYSDAIAGIESRRPDPRPLESMWLSLKTRRDKVLVIGSNPRKDFKMPRKEGYRTLRVLTGEHALIDYPAAAYEADFCLMSLNLLPDLLRQTAQPAEEKKDKGDTTLRIA